jgi:ribonuclease III
VALDGALEQAPAPNQVTLAVPRRTTTLDDLEHKLGYVFSDKDLVERALTHVSANGSSYQRLEFLGDRVLGLAVAELLYAAFPKAQEGEMSRRLSDLVRRETCADLAAAWHLAPHLKLSKGEIQQGGRKSRTILADVFEAILGAVFLDGGYSAARDVIERAYGERLTERQKPAHDAKTALQEWAQGRGLPTPCYEVVEQSGPDHKPMFRIAARVPPLPEGIGLGASKRVAEQEAAQSLLVREGVWKEARHGGPGNP